MSNRPSVFVDPLAKHLFLAAKTRLFDDILVPTFSKQMLFERSSIPSNQKPRPLPQGRSHFFGSLLAGEDGNAFLFNGGLGMDEFGNAERLLSTNLKDQTSKL